MTETSSSTSSRAPGGGPSSRAAEGFRWRTSHTIALSVLCLATLLELIDVTIVNVTLPTMQADLHFSATGATWIINAYLVTFGGLMLLGGRVGDLFGYRRIFLSGVVVFTLASLASGLAPNAATLVTARAVQGAAAAFIAPMTLSMIASTFPEGKPRNLAVSAWGAIGGISGTLGVVIGGLLVAGPGWRWIFYVNIPVGILILLLSPRYLSARRPASRHRSFDIVGAVAVTAGVGLLAYAIAETGQYAWGSGRTIGCLAGAAALLAYFVFHEARVASDPLVPLRIFRIRSVTASNLFAPLGGASLYALFFFFALYMQQVLHYSALKTGLLYLPLTLAIVVFALVAQTLVPYLGVRYIMAAGAVIAGAGLLLYVNSSPSDSLWQQAVVPSIVTGGGMALWFVPMTIAAIAGVPGSMAGLASGLANVTRTVGGALGVAIASSVATAHAASLIAAGHPVASALTSGYHRGYVVGAIMLGVAALVSLALFRKEGRGQKMDMTELSMAGIEE
ncbi:MAG: MFS transporter [Nocardiopsaceae bacterium]|nr:MFS transporter [Nocardiopsaceae bacterium]